MCACVRAHYRVVTYAEHILQTTYILFRRQHTYITFLIFVKLLSHVGPLVLQSINFHNVSHVFALRTSTSFLFLVSLRLLQEHYFWPMVIVHPQKVFKPHQHYFLKLFHTLNFQYSFYTSSYRLFCLDHALLLRQSSLVSTIAASLRLNFIHLTYNRALILSNNVLYKDKYL